MKNEMNCLKRIERMIVFLSCFSDKKLNLIIILQILALTLTLSVFYISNF